MVSITKKYLNDLTYKVIGSAIEVHKVLGPTLLEGVYQKCFLHELSLRGIKHRSEVWTPLQYKGLQFNAVLRLDVLIEEVLCVELKAQEGFAPIHDATLLSYMHILQKPKGILLNFHCSNIVKEGQRTLINKLLDLLPEE